ncbi:MAG TPA: trypsin-like peptidase domain-containing protein, partial [Actinomycetota bacterium]|nr:trypsin-like peptidase domain-containing protein [Actinomycetota bacterium]
MEPTATSVEQPDAGQARPAEPPAGPWHSTAEPAAPWRRARTSPWSEPAGETAAAPAEETPPLGPWAVPEPALSQDEASALPAWPAPLPGIPSTSEPPPEGTARSRPGRPFIVFLSALLGAVLGVGSTIVVLDRAGVGGIGGGEVRVVDPPVQGGGTANLDGVAAVAKAVSPSIVRIDTRARSAFGSQSGTGSGVIYRTDGYIITNAHVVDGATSVEVTLSTGDTLQGSVVGTAAPIDDIAVVKVNRDKLPAATLGSVLNTNVGDTAIAIGSPFGLSGTVTAGIVSAIRANLSLGNQQFVDVIQTDAPINPGNSGGALVNSRGEVVGINTAILGGEANVGIGFAIPIDIARKEADDIIRIGRATRAFLGVEPATVPGRNGAR